MNEGTLMLVSQTHSSVTYYAIQEGSHDAYKQQSVRAR